MLLTKMALSTFASWLFVWQNLSVGYMEAAAEDNEPALHVCFLQAQSRCYIILPDPEQRLYQSTILSDPSCGICY